MTEEQAVFFFTGMLFGGAFACLVIVILSERKVRRTLDKFDEANGPGTPGSIPTRCGVCGTPGATMRTPDGVAVCGVQCHDQHQDRMARSNAKR